MQFIDLSVKLDENTPIYPGNPAIEILTASRLAEDGFNDKKITLGNHIGTHIDAPAHMIESGKTLDTYPLETYIGNGIAIDVRNGFDIHDIENAAISAKDIVLLYTGMSAKSYEPSYFNDSPEIPLDFAQELVKRGIKTIGMDMCSPDGEPFAIHKLFLSNDILIIENLTNLNQLIGKRFKIIALPLNMSIDGAPARVIAEVVS